MGMGPRWSYPQARYGVARLCKQEWVAWSVGRGASSVPKTATYGDPQPGRLDMFWGAASDNGYERSELAPVSGYDPSESTNQYVHVRPKAPVGCVHVVKLRKIRERSLHGPTKLPGSGHSWHKA